MDGAAPAETVASMVEPLRAVTVPVAEPQVTWLDAMDTPPSTAVPFSWTTSGEPADAGTAMVRTTCTWLLPPVGVVRNVPDTWSLNDDVGSAEEAAVETEPVLAVPAPPPSLARRAAEVPDRCDQPGRSGPARAKTPMPRTTTRPAAAAPTRQPAERADPAARRQAPVATTAATQTASMPRATDSRVSLPVPRPWRTATGQQR